MPLTASTCRVCGTVSQRRIECPDVVDQQRRCQLARARSPMRRQRPQPVAQLVQRREQGTPTRAVSMRTISSARAFRSAAPWTGFHGAACDARRSVGRQDRDALAGGDLFGRHLDCPTRLPRSSTRPRISEPKSMRSPRCRILGRAQVHARLRARIGPVRWSARAGPQECDAREQGERQNAGTALARLRRRSIVARAAHRDPGPDGRRQAERHGRRCSRELLGEQRPDQQGQCNRNERPLDARSTSPCRQPVHRPHDARRPLGLHISARAAR